MRQCKKVIGLTGGIATGKSTASKIFRKEGFTIIDADEIAQNILGYSTPAYYEVINYFGKEILLDNGFINRKALGKIVFSDDMKRKKLNEITHRKILEEIINQRDRTLKKENVVIIDIPLLIEEKNLLKEFGIEFDELILIYTTRDNQLKRLMYRDSINRDLAMEKINSQMNIEDKLDKADIIINNNGSIEDLEIKIKKYIDNLCD